MEKRKGHYFAVVIVSAIAVWAPNTPAKTFNGATTGSFAVSPTGSATYTIPIEVPPGINGLQPQLALVYNSQGGNGPLGVGWSLSGLSAVTRCGATFDQDGYKGGVKVDASDRYCLDGQRLVVVTGSYGGIGATYRTEIDGGAKISATMYGSGNPASFQVEAKTGLINRAQRGNVWVEFHS